MSITGTPIVGTSFSGILGDMVTQLRNELHDTNDSIDSSPLWTDTELLEYLVDAENEVCWRAYAIEDRTTASVVTINITSGTQEYPLNAKVIFAQTCKLTSNGQWLDKKSENEIRRDNSSYLTTSGTPTMFWEREGYIGFYPKPNASDTASLIVYRLPLTALSASNTTPSVNSKYYEAMKKWAKYRAYMKEDTQTKDSNQSTIFFKLFVMEVGERPNLNIERIVKQQPESMQITIKR